MKDLEFDWCCATQAETTAHLRETVPGMSDEELSWLPRPVQAEAREIRDAAAAQNAEPGR